MEAATIKVFEVNDTEWWAGTDLESIKTAYKEITGIDPDDEDEGFQDPHALTDEEMETLQFSDDDGSKRSFREQLELMVAAEREKFPTMFATTEY
ncbi:MAG: phiPLPE 70 [Acidobacteriales bacterium]|nr:phiPLPE 70 [Terriglobales bacterium]